MEVWLPAYVTGSPVGYRHLGPPTSTATVADLGGGGFAPTCSATYNTSPTPGTVPPFPTAFTYDEARQLTAQNNLSAFDKGWTAFTAVTNPLFVGQGLTGNMPGNRRIVFNGPLNNGDITLPLTRHAGPNTGPASSGAWAGWHLVSNPYPSPLDWSLVPTTDRPGLDASIYAFEASGQYAGRYLSYTNGLGDLDPVLAMGQGFWVRVSSGQTSGTLALKNPARRSEYVGHVSIIRRGSAPRPTLRLALAPEASPALADNLFVYVEAGASTGLDAQFDAAKMPNPNGLGLSATASTGEALAIQGLPALGNGTTTVPLALALPAPGRYVLAVGELTAFAPGTRLVLRDQLLNTATPLTAATRYAFASAAAAVPGRFFLDLAPAGAPLASASPLAAATLAVYPNPASRTATLRLPAAPVARRVQVRDALGRAVRAATLPAQATELALDLNGLAPGLYVVRCGAATTRLVVE